MNAGFAEILTRSRLFQFASPRAVPIHRRPSLAPRREWMRVLGSCCLLGAVQGTNRTPSKRTNPPSVPIHKYPSFVWVIACGVPVKNPSWIRQAVCAYCEIRRFGSRAPAETVNSKMKAHTENGRKRRRVLPRTCVRNIASQLCSVRKSTRLADLITNDKTSIRALTCMLLAQPIVSTGGCDSLEIVGKRKWGGVRLPGRSLG